MISENVSWTGDNSGVYLRETEDGPYVALASYFRIAWSPKGAGVALVLIENPNERGRSTRWQNVVLHDNEALGRWLVEDYALHFPQFRGLPAMEKLDFVRLASHRSEGGPAEGYSETFVAEEVEVALSWHKLGASYFVRLDPSESATGRDEMYTAFVEAWDAGGTVNGRPLKGKVFPRLHQGRKSSSAFLAFSETWLR